MTHFSDGDLERLTHVNRTMGQMVTSQGFCACGRRLYHLEPVRCVQCMKTEAERSLRVWRYVLYG